MFNQTLASHLLVFSPQRQTEHFEVGRGRRKPCAKVSFWGCGCGSRCDFGNSLLPKFHNHIFTSGKSKK